jgi:hypothetical protein
MRLLAILGLLIAVGAGITYLNYGTVEPCGVLRERMRHRTARDGGNLGGFLASVTPDNVIDGIIAAQYNKPVTPLLCIGILLGTEPAPAPQPDR